MVKNMIGNVLGRAVKRNIVGTKSVIKRVVKKYDVNLSEFELASNPTFAQFFEREFKPGMRNFDNSKDIVCAFCEGTVTESGKVSAARLYQAKKHVYTLEQLLRDERLTAEFAYGNYCTIYLNPGNYHGIHVPIHSRLVYHKYIPGKKYSVNERSVKRRLVYPENARLVAVFDNKDIGRYVMVMIAAFNVSDFAMDLQEDKRYKKGDKIGKFRIGSTVMMIANNVNFDRYGKVLLGERIGEYLNENRS